MSTNIISVSNKQAFDKILRERDKNIWPLLIRSTLVLQRSEMYLLNRKLFVLCEIKRWS